MHPVDCSFFEPNFFERRANNLTTKRDHSHCVNIENTFDHNRIEPMRAGSSQITFNLLNVHHDIKK